MIYLDNAATTKVRREVLDEMLPYFSEYYTNPSSIYSPSRMVSKKVEEARKLIAGTIGAEASEIYFTSGGSESDNWAIKKIMISRMNKGKHMITTKVEHHAVLESCKYLESLGFEVTYLNVNEDGLIDLNGKKLLDCEYDEISAMKGIENSLLIRKDGYVGLANNAGTILIDVKYSDIKNLGTTYKEGYITTDENGKAASKDLQIGTYTYKEVSVPKGYVIDENEYEFAVTSKETKIEKTVVNNRAKGALKIIKLEKGTKTPIEGVTFEILDENKNVVDTIVTNKDGIAEKQDLIVGKYYYREISAPDKYIVDSKEKSFKLTDNGEIFEATVYNEAKTLPVTGGSLSLDMLIVLMVAGFSIVGFTTMKVVKEKKEHNL